MQAQRLEAEAKRSAAAWRLQLVQSVLRLREAQDWVQGCVMSSCQLLWCWALSCLVLYSDCPVAEIELPQPATLRILFCNTSLFMFVCLLLLRLLR